MSLLILSVPHSILITIIITQQYSIHPTRTAPKHEMCLQIVPYNRASESRPRCFFGETLGVHPVDMLAVFLCGLGTLEFEAGARSAWLSLAYETGKGMDGGTYVGVSSSFSIVNGSSSRCTFRTRS